MVIRGPSEQNPDLHTTSIHYVAADGRKMVGVVFNPEPPEPPVYALRAFERAQEGASAGVLAHAEQADRLGQAHSGITPRWARVE